MTLVDIGQAIQRLSIFTAVRESRFVYPILLSTHLACIATFGGLILATNLRLLGWILPDVPAGALIRALRPWKRLGFVAMIGAGLMLGGSKAAEYLANPFFLVKMLLLGSVVIHGWLFRRSVYRASGATMSVTAARTAGALSIVLWLAVLSMGRWIAYYDPPSAPDRASFEVAR